MFGCDAWKAVAACSGHWAGSVWSVLPSNWYWKIGGTYHVISTAAAAGEAAPEPAAATDGAALALPAGAAGLDAAGIVPGGPPRAGGGPGDKDLAPGQGTVRRALDCALDRIVGHQTPPSSVRCAPHASRGLSYDLCSR